MLIGATIQQLADRAQVNGQTIVRFESGKILKKSTIAKIHTALIVMGMNFS